MNREIDWRWVIVAVVVAVLVIVGGLYWQDKRRTAELARYREEAVRGENRPSPEMMRRLGVPVTSAPPSAPINREER